MAFVREIGRNGILYSGIWPRYVTSIKSNQIESLYMGRSIAINRIEKKRYQCHP